MHKLSKALTFIGALLALTFCAVSCKTDDDNEPTMYTVTVTSSIEHGKVTADKSSAEAGAKVKLTATADSGYELGSYSVKDEKSNPIKVTEGTFTMPKSNVTVSATFKETAETVNQNAAAAVIAKITAIGTVVYTSESKAKIDDARKAYDALTEAQKKLVPAEKLALLTAAEASYNSQKATADKANAVIAKITAIGTVTYTDESKAKIDEARKAYDALTEAQKELVPEETLALLTAAEASYNSQKATADKANAVIAKITAIGTVTYTSESKAKIDDARAAYNALTEAQKALVPAETLALLTAAETKYAELKAAAEQQSATYTVKIASGIANGTVTASPTTAAAGTEITLAAEAARGYTFGSYTVTDADGKAVTVTGNKFTMPTSNVTVSATFTALPPATASYTVKHLQQNIADNNYTLKESETKTGTVGEETDVSAKSYEGFTAQSVTQATIAASGTEVEIKYDRNTYTVTFDSNGGSDVSSQSLRYGATATKPADPTKTATTTTKYTFDGWYSDSGLTTPFSFDTAIKKDITLYAKWTETEVIQAGSISYATTSVEKTTADEAFTNELTKTGNGTVTYSSSDENVATVNASTGEVTIVGAGTATITATVTDSASYTYATKTASYTLTVTVAGISVTDITISNAPTEALFVNSTGTLTATVSPDNATDKTIVWSSSDSDYVSINAETGEYTIMGTKGYGSATITATATNGTEDTADDVTVTCTIAGKVTYTSLKAGDVLHVGDTFYVGQVYFNTTPAVSFNNSNGVITLVENDATGTLCYKFKRSSNGTMPNVTAYRVTDNTDGIYIVSGGGTSQGDRFTLAVHTKPITFTVKRVAKEGYGYADGSYTIAAGTTWQQFIDSGNAPACLSIGTSGIYSGKVCHDMNFDLGDCGGTLIANTADNKHVKSGDAIIDGATYACSDYLKYEDHD